MSAWQLTTHHKNYYFNHNSHFWPTKDYLVPFPSLSQTTGIIVTIMIVASCLSCCSFAALCSAGDCPRAIRICGCVGAIIVLAALSVYMGWVALGTYLVIKLHGNESVCRNTIVYLVLLYAYLIILAILCFVLLLWKCNDWRKSIKTNVDSRMKRRQKAAASTGSED